MLKKIIYKLNKVLILSFNPKVKFGKKINFRIGFNITKSKKAKIVIGEGCFFNRNCSINAKKSIVIGNDCIFGENVKIYDHNHVFNIKDKKIKDQGYSIGCIAIGNNCWIGSNVIILKGVSIGDNVVIAAGSIINRDIPSNTVVRVNQTLYLEEIRFKE